MSTERRSREGVPDLSWIVDLQGANRCGFEAVENVIQLCRGGSNEISESALFPVAREAGWVCWEHPEGPRLFHHGYAPLLERFGIRATWHAMDPAPLVHALAAHRVAIATVEMSIVDPAAYGEPCYHAVVVTKHVLDPAGRLVGYVGLDSNFPRQQRYWDAAAFARAADPPPHPSLLITEDPTHGVERIRHYLLRGPRHLEAVR